MQVFIFMRQPQCESLARISWMQLLGGNPVMIIAWKISELNSARFTPLCFLSTLVYLRSLHRDLKLFMLNLGLHRFGLIFKSSSNVFPGSVYPYEHLHIKIHWSEVGAVKFIFHAVTCVSVVHLCWFLLFLKYRAVLLQTIEAVCFQWESRIAPNRRI